jgi:hypothetical protein
LIVDLWGRERENCKGAEAHPTRLESTASKDTPRFVRLNNVIEELGHSDIEHGRWEVGCNTQSADCKEGECSGCDVEQLKAPAILALGHVTFPQFVPSFPHTRD